MSSLRAALAVALLCGGGADALAAPPPAGTYDTQLCVSVAQASAECGAAEARWRDRSRLQVQVSDVVFRLHLRSSQADVTLMHGAMQIDEFSAPYEWNGDTLRFEDRDKRTRYELRPGERRR